MKDGVSARIELQAEPLPCLRGPEDDRVCRLDKARKRDLASFLVLPSNPTPISQPRRRLERAGMGFL